MKKLLLFAAVAGLGLVSASPPGKGPDEGAREAPRHYPPCSRAVRDRCIQLHERGVRAPPRGDHHAAMAGHAGAGHGEHHAGADHREHHAGAGHHGGPEHHARGDHRNCPDHHAHVDRRGHGAVEHRTGRRVVRIAQARHAAPPPRHHAQRVRRAGERG